MLGAAKPCDDGHLALGVKCGSSDTTSGIGRNPAVGYLFDKLVAAGDTVFFGENTEIIGAERVLANRAANKQVAEAILRVSRETEERAPATGNPVTYRNVGNSIDYYSGTVTEGTETLEQAGERFYEIVLDIASGTMTRVETVNGSDPIPPYVKDPDIVRN